MLKHWVSLEGFYKKLKKKIKLFSNFKTKSQVFERDNFQCRLCGDNNSDVELQTHHLTPRSIGGSHGAYNLITVCESCHYFLHANPKIILKQRENIKKSIENRRKEGRHIGRPFGSKDSKPRKTDGYHQRYIDEKQSHNKQLVR